MNKRAKFLVVLALALLLSTNLVPLGIVLAESPLSVLQQEEEQPGDTLVSNADLPYEELILILQEIVDDNNDNYTRVFLVISSSSVLIIAGAIFLLDRQGKRTEPIVHGFATIGMYAVGATDSPKDDEALAKFLDRFGHGDLAATVRARAARKQEDAAEAASKEQASGKSLSSKLDS